MNNKKNILILAPHTDDGEFGCGGSISKLINSGVSVYYAAFSICEESVPDGYPKDILEKEVKDSTRSLGIEKNNLFIKNFPVRRFHEFRQEILDYMIFLKNKINPDLVFTTSSFDIHQDHKVIHNESLRAFKDRSLLGYEFVWNNFSFTPNMFITLNEKNLNDKYESIKKYKSQSHRLYLDKDLIYSAAKYRGLQVKKKYAESFEILRWII